MNVCEREERLRERERKRERERERGKKVRLYEAYTHYELVPCQNGVCAKLVLS